ncbi:MAG: UDP-N-acetylmuramoyl-tripeptide--D-alanyl-D-alanine ligase [Gaiellaceae bacterium]|nr:UDP-N-acetylmuramoyl-tripeptide--D-alanyl-D-alanine ligase [Gaiellaceae bacterium]
MVLPVVLAAARVYRRLLVGPTFIGITGSAAKTTTKDLLAEVLGTTLRGTKTPANDNRVSSVARTILGTKLRDSFSIAEVAAWRPGSVAEVSKLVRPGIAVVTTIGLDHRSRFRSLDAIAAEKGALVAALPADGIAVLNADDPQVIAMAEGFPGHVITFGEDPGAMVRAEDVHSSWPEHLRFTLCLGGRRYPVRTRLNGRHWTTSVLASFAVAVAMDVPVESALPAVAAFEPMGARMNAVEVDGITFVRDDNKSPYWSLGTVLDFVAEARAERTVLVLGTLSDYAGSASIKYRQSAERALAVADEVVFVGRNSKYALKARTNGGGNLSTFLTVREAAEHFRTELRPGDLVVLKGSNRADHLLRLFLTRTTDVRCWRTACGRRRFCDACELLHVPEEPPAARA